MAMQRRDKQGVIFQVSFTFLLQRNTSAQSHCGMKVRIKENSWFAKMAAVKLKAEKVAIVFGSTIHLHNTGRSEFLQDKKWVCHELQHVRQYRQNGFIPFITRYFFESIRHGYYNNKFEVEARENETNGEVLNEVQFV